MTNEEIDAEIKRLQTLKEQNNRAQTTESNNPADGIYNPADYISQITSKMNKASYTDEQGNKKSYGRGDKFSKNLDVAKNAGKIGNRTEDQFGNPLPDTAYEYITQMLNSERAKGSVSKHTLRMIENEAKARYNLPRNFDISGKGWFGNTDAAMARAMNSMAYNGKAQQTQQTKPAQTPQTQTQGTQGTSQTQQVDDDMQFMQQYSKAAGSLKPEDRAFLTPENIKRYSDLVHKQNETKKTNKNAKKIEELKQSLELHKKIMTENPNRPDIQKAQQTHINSIIKDIQKLGGSVE